MLHLKAQLPASPFNTQQALAGQGCVSRSCSVFGKAEGFSRLRRFLGSTSRRAARWQALQERPSSRRPATWRTEKGPTAYGKQKATPASPEQAAPRISPFAREMARKGAMTKRKSWQTLVGLLFLLGFTQAADKAVMSIAPIPMAKQFGWADSDKGYIGSAFFWGFMLSQIAGGMFGQRFGSRAVLTAVMGWWSACSLLTPLAATRSLSALLVVRTLLGLGEGICVPIVTNLLAEKVPLESRGKAMAVAFSGGTLGTIVALLVAPSLLSWAPWPLLFQAVGSLGLLWLVGWRLVGPKEKVTRKFVLETELINHPIDPPRSTPGQISPGLRQRQVPGDSSAVHETVQVADYNPKPVPAGIPWRGFARSKAVWAIAGAHFCSSWGFYTALTWLPTFFSQRLHLGLAEASRLTLLPWAVSFVAGNAAGWLADRLTATGMHKTRVRRVMQSIAFLGPAVCLLFLARVTSAAGAVFLLSGVLGLGAFASGGFCCNHADISPKYAGLLFAITNTVGCFAGSTSVSLTGQILEKCNEWSYIWLSTAGVYMLGTIWYTSLASTEVEFE